MRISMRYSLPRAAFVLAISSLVGTGGAYAQDAAPTPPEGMVFVPAGDFTMGTDNTDNTDDNQGTNTPLNNNDARPRHTATTQAFFLDKTEVTNEQYKRFCDATNYPPPPHWVEGKFPAGEADFPVTRVNWFEARAFAMWSGKRLPTEIEWEHAARGTDGRSYPWGEQDTEEFAVWKLGLASVGSKPKGASPYGALDMSGNVAEWTSSWFEPYPNSPTKQPDFGKKTLKVVRGGTWYSGSGKGQTYYRAVCRPDQRNMWIGFRCVRDVN